MAVNAEVPHRFSDPAKYILHPTDFSPESELAFAHALRIALTNKSRLTLMHVGETSHAEWDSFPSVRETLQRWGLLAPGAARADVAKLGVTVKKVDVLGGDVVESISGYLVEHPIDLLVLSTTQRQGLASWLRPSKAVAASRKMAVPTLFVPDGSWGCVALEDGQVTMNQVLIPVDHQPPVGGAIERALRAIRAFGGEESQVTLLHVGPEDQFPSVAMPPGPWPITRAVRQGNPVAEIVSAAAECGANLLIMVTRGTHGFLDMLRGTTTEQVLRQVACPVLAIPAEF